MNKIDIIKYEGDNSTFVWQHPAEDFYTGTQLIVHESQEAVLFMNGQALDLFGAGRHILSVLTTRTPAPTPTHSSARSSAKEDGGYIMTLSQIFLDPVTYCVLY